MLTAITRRLLMFVPTATLMSAVVFVVQPGAADDPYGHLPRFVNAAPLDARARATMAVQALAEGERPGARDEIARLGGAALPIVVPALEGLSTEARERVADALAPVGRRMGLITEGTAPLDAAGWSTFWQEHAIDFGSVAVKRAVRRYALHPSASRLREIELLDTMALDAAFDLLGSDGDLPADEVAAALVPFVGPRLGSSPFEAEALGPRVVELRARWFARRIDYVALGGPDRAAALLLETQYAKWVARTAATNQSDDRDGRAPLRRLVEGAARTGLRLSAGIALGLAIAVAAAAWSLRARERRRWVVALALATAAAAPTVWLGRAVLETGTAGATPARSEGFLAEVAHAGVIAAASAFVAAVQTRRAALDTLSTPHAHALLGLGGSLWRAARRALLRPTTIALLATTAAEAPTLASASLVLEHVLRLDGLGPLAFEAIATRDLASLMGLSVVGAALAHAFAALAETSHELCDARVTDRERPW